MHVCISSTQDPDDARKKYQFEGRGAGWRKKLSCIVDAGILYLKKKEKK